MEGRAPCSETCSSPLDTRKWDREMSHLFVAAETGPLACIQSACLVPNRCLIPGIEESGAGSAGLEDSSVTTVVMGEDEWGMARGSRCLAASGMGSLISRSARIVYGASSTLLLAAGEVQLVRAIRAIHSEEAMTRQIQQIQRLPSIAAANGESVDHIRRR